MLPVSKRWDGNNEEAIEHGSGRELIEAVGARYRKAERAEKKQILDEFVALAGFHPKHAIRVLRRERRGKISDPGTTSRVYDEAVITALTVIWEGADRICGNG